MCIENALGNLKNCNVGDSGPMYDIGLMRDHAWGNHCKGFVHTRARFQGKNPVRREEESCGCKTGDVEACLSCRDCTTPCPGCVQ